MNIARRQIPREEEQQRANNPDHFDLDRIYCCDLPVSVPLVSGLNLQSCHSNGLTDPEGEVDNPTSK